MDQGLAGQVTNPCWFCLFVQTRKSIYVPCLHRSWGRGGRGVGWINDIDQSTAQSASVGC